MSNDLTPEQREALETAERKLTFREELRALINRYSQENHSGTPDFILAQSVLAYMGLLANTINERERWYGREQDPRFGMPITKGLVVNHNGE